MIILSFYRIRLFDRIKKLFRRFCYRNRSQRSVQMAKSRRISTIRANVWRWIHFYYHYIDTSVAAEIRFSEFFTMFYFLSCRFAISHRRERRTKRPSVSRPRLVTIVVQKTARFEPLRKHEIGFCAKTRSEYTTYM